MNANLQSSETTGENVELQGFLKKAQVAMTSVSMLETLLKVTTSKAATFAGILANLKKYEPLRFPTVWSNSKDELFSTQREILTLIHAYGEALSKSTGENIGRGYVGALLHGFVSSEIRQESDIDSERPANLAKLSCLLLSWEQSPNGDMSPSGILGRLISLKVAQVCEKIE